MNQSSWIAVDWGTSNMRVWVMAPSGDVLARYASDKGMNKLKPDQYEPLLLDLLAQHLPTAGSVPVIVCGMAGARGGWTEAGYTTVPAAPAIGATVKVASNDHRLDVHIIPGMNQLDPADVMRGEETQLAGYLAQSGVTNGIVCLPGTHSKWTELSGGQLIRFKTVMTGELFDLLSNQSILRLSVSQDMDNDVFIKTVLETHATPDEAIARLFEIRAEGILKGTSGSAARAKLSGLVLGMELVAVRQYWQGQQVALIGSPKLAAAYKTALTALGTDAVLLDAEQITLAGLSRVHHTLFG